MIPDIAPEYVEFEGGFRDTPEWGSAFIISPWYVYLWYGDTRLIEKYYPAMQEYLRYLQSQAKDNIVAYGLGDWFDIGPGNPVSRSSRRTASRPRPYTTMTCA